jgi:hypothetical protein
MIPLELTIGHQRAHPSQILDLLAEDSRLNVYAGELECAHQVRPLLCPARRVCLGAGAEIRVRPTSVVLLNASMLETSRVEMTVSILRCRRHN